jgi:arylsulfatase A-like enzyme
MNKNSKIVYLEGESSILMVKEALDFAQRNSEQPLFIVLWYGSPHWPYKTLPEDLEGFSPELSENDAKIYGEIRALDRSIGLLKEGLKAMGELDNTLLWFCSDNGGRYAHDPFANGGLKGSKGQLLEGGIRVPGIIEWPARIKEGFATDFPATTMDIMPTLVDLLDLPKNSMLDVVDGESIAPLFEGKTPKRTKNIAIVSKGISIFNEKYKYIRHGNGVKAPTELYDIENDPNETTDISGQYPEILKQLKKEADDVEASVARSAEGKDYPEGKVLQPQRGAQWSNMPEYQALYETFAKLKPGWTPPREKTPRK